MIKRSKFEDRVAKYLTMKGIDYEYERESYTYTEPLRKNSSTCATCGGRTLIRRGKYTPDFFLSNGYIIETKGRFDAADRRKMIAMKNDHPHLRIVMLFMRDNKIGPKSKTYYSDWCMTHGYEFAFGLPAKEWLQ